MRFFSVTLHARALVVLLAGLAAAWPSSQAQSAGFPLVRAYSANEIGGDATSWIAVQDKNGILYFGARDLITFDGDRWSLSSMNGAHAIRALDFSADSLKLWAGAIGELGWFERASGGELKYHSLNQHLPREAARFGDVWHVFASANGATFVSDDKVMRWNGAVFQVWQMTGERRLRAFRVGDTLLLQHAETGLYTLEADGPRLFVPANRLGPRGIFYLERRGPDWFIIANDGVFLLTAGALQAIHPAVAEVLRANSPTYATAMSDGRYAVGTVRGGIVLLRPDGSLDQILGPGEGLPTRYVNSVFVDRDQQLWATSYTHIFRISASSASTVFDARANLPNKPFHRIVSDGQRILAATDDSVFQLGPRQKTFSRFEALLDRVFDLKGSSQGMLAAGFRSVWRVTPGGTTTLYSSSSDTYVAQELGDGRILIADGRRVVALDAAGRTRTLVSDLPDQATSLAVDRSGHLWLGTDTQGIFVAPLTGREHQKPERSPSLPKNPGGLGIVRETYNGSVVLLDSFGTWIVRSRDAEKFQAVEGYPSRTLIAASNATPSGEIWTVHSGGGLAPCVGVISTDARTVWKSHSVEGLDGIGTPQTIFAESIAPGTTVLWIGGTNGILRHVVAHGLSAPQPRPPLLLRAVARNSDNDAPEAITGPLPYSTRSIEFEFAEPDFTRRAALRLQTRIVGVDPDWVPADPASRQTLTAVRDGRYTFQVRAVAETGIASEPRSFTFEVLPPWWRTMPALLGAAVALVPLGYGFYRLRVRSLRRRNVELEEKVRRRTEELERASAAKTEFVANMSHDIRNPLNGIVGLTLALEDTRLEQRQREIVATLRECTTYLSTLVDDVLDFASIEAGRVELRPGPFVPNELLRSIVTTLKADTAERGALLLVEADPSLPASVLGDAGRIQQILVNYVSNALKYAGGHIRLSAAVPADSPGEIEFSVADEGPGISEEEKATLFTKFTRLSGARREDIPGAGLGLAACRLLADIMGGSVGVDSVPGRGARFYLRLPLTIVAAPTETAAPNLPNTTVLVVEDTDYNAWAAAAVLAKLGLTCERARTGEEALQLFRERRFNVVLLDRNLPDMDGTEVARQMRAMESDGLQAVLLAVTAYCTAEDRARCLKSGMDAFVGKPLTPEKLRRVLINTGRRQLAAASVHVSPEISPPTVLDLSLLKYLSDGTPESLEGEIGRYLARLADCHAEIASSAAAGDWLNTAAAAHGLHGHAKLISATTLADVASQVERAATTRNETETRARLRQLEAEIEVVRELFRHHRSSERRA